MQLFTNKNYQFLMLKEKPFKLEREIQKLVEQNLAIVSDYQFVKSEFSIKNCRIDALVFNQETKSCVILEFKRDRNYSVIDQGLSYLNLMLENKAEFIIEYNEVNNSSLKRNEIDWSQSKVIFIAPNFSNYQKQSTNFKDLTIELWEIKRFENDIILINEIKKSKSAPSIKQIETSNNDLENNALNKIAKEIVVYNEEYHIENKSDDLIALYESFKNSILQLAPEIEIVATKLYLAFKKDKTNLVNICLLSKSLKIWINAKYGEINDSKNITKNVENIGHWGNGDYEISANNTDNVEYIMSLVKQIL